jgi:hypothetical protein
MRKAKFAPDIYQVHLLTLWRRTASPPIVAIREPTTNGYLASGRNRSIADEGRVS